MSKLSRPLAFTVGPTLPSTVRMITERQNSLLLQVIRSTCRASDQDVVMRPRRTIWLLLTSKMSAKSARIAISRLKPGCCW